MPAKRKPQVSSKIVAKPRQVLEFAEQQARKAVDWAELSNALFSSTGKATLAFPTTAERTAFCRTAEYKRILALLDGLSAPAVKEFLDQTASANGALSIDGVADIVNGGDGNDTATVDNLVDQVLNVETVM